ncbi:hypothetical protein T459_11979 [Capsicum annuum]|uniref:Glycosyltransferase family 28 N-terminal domain-containing protein n=1 Tax=Capsicum annuum TaxID=4072 RepID=A0A2G2ZNH4_CAPAN|nr:hypothetical protein T459_11979 [Capsicum annuum]
MMVLSNLISRMMLKPPIVMLIVGTCGDVQPFTAIDKRLQFLDKTVDAGFWPSVRLATHANFKEFVLTAGLEFYPLGGDPKILAEYMVKNKGFLPSGPSEIPTQRNQMKEIIYSLLPACKEADMDTGVPFKAGAIIANPPAYEANPELKSTGALLEVDAHFSFSETGPVFHILLPCSVVIQVTRIWVMLSILNEWDSSIDN